MDLLNKAYGCLLGGLIGDAMGTPTENMESEAIEDQLGWVDNFEGDGTDDSILKYLLCDALVVTDGHATSDDWAAAWLENRMEITGPKRNRFFVSVHHTFKKLLSGYLPRQVSTGNLPSSSSAMSISPIGIVNAGHPRAASAQAQELGSLIHTGDVSFCQDGAAAVAAVLGLCYLADGDPQKAVVYEANFGRDTDTIATMAGAICGAYTGVGGFPREWVQKAETASSRDQRELADMLMKTAKRKSAAETEAWRMLNNTDF